MNAQASHALNPHESMASAIREACDTIAPTWPLDRMIAVNPYWGHIHQPFPTAGKKIGQLAGSPFTMPISYYRDKWQTGEIQLQHLAKAIAEAGSALTPLALVAGLDSPANVLTPAPLLCDSLDRQRNLLHEPAWCDTITHQIGQFCAAFFDRAQADWRPDQRQTLYASWRQTLARDHSVALLMKAPAIPRKTASLAEDPHTQIQHGLAQLGVPATQWAPYLQAVMMRVSGWAAWCAYLRWQARLADADDNTLVDILAIRLSWECLIDDGNRSQHSAWEDWQAAWQAHFQATDDQASQAQLLWQRAHEISYQEGLFRQLSKPASGNGAVTAPEVQAVFCIDVRSEVFRRHLEAQSPGIQTLGFAGFFGLPISYTPLGTQATRPQLPGLLAPAMDISESSGDREQDRAIIATRQKNLRHLLGWRPFKSVPGSAFTLVETLGLACAGSLVKCTLPSAAPRNHADHLALDHAQAQALRPTLQATLAGDTTTQARIAAQALTGMGLTSGLAPLVLLIGHGSQNRNNPQQAGLDCGACCGQTGEVNARALAGLLNDSAVRAQLEKDGIPIPAETLFIAGLHNTTTDEVELFDTGAVMASRQAALDTLNHQLIAAGQATRQERAPSLGLGHLANNTAKLTRAIRKRANDWAQTRPEWGLANNAAFIVAPRSRTRGIHLAGRSFLHEYDHQKDPDNKVLELIMTAPMIVTHWINMQYYGSTVDNKRYGSGNKTLHNVVGGRLGVFEGNGGDLRIGLAWQSVNDGECWRHEPLRLTVVIDAPREAIAGIIDRHTLVQDLVNHQWLYLARFEGGHIECYHHGQWQAWT